jgi:hypothetical protein
VQDALGRIPEALEEVRERLKIFYNERVMHKANSALYVSILDVLGRILLFYKQRAISESAAVEASEGYLRYCRKATQCSVGQRS